MEKPILVAGATGKLGQKICRELIKMNARVSAVVRAESKAKNIEALQQMGVELQYAELSDTEALTKACAGVHTVVSALAGLHEVIVEAQVNLVEAAIAADVHHFIPSDFCSDYTKIPAGENRNFDLRREFQAYLNQRPIRATSIFNGCFADILRYNTPLFNVPEKTIVYYDEKQDWKIDFTTMDDTAAFTAHAAMEDSADRYLKIASFSVSPNELEALSKTQKGTPFELVHGGNMEDFSAYNKTQRAADPDGENELYPRWQQSQYIYSMFLAHHDHLDNDRFGSLSWSPVEENI
jgi:hypothetical protein